MNFKKNYELSAEIEVAVKGKKSGVEKLAALGAVLLKVP